MKSKPRSDRTCAPRPAIFALFAVLSTVSVFFSSASADEKEGSAPEIRRIGVVSIAGDLLYDDRIGMIAFGNDLARHDVAEWGLDDAWEDGLEVALDDLTDAEIVPLAIDRANLALLAFPTEEDEKGVIAQYRAPKFKRLATSLQTIASDNDLDAILLMASDAFELYPSNQSLEAFGLFRSGKKGPTYYYIIARLHLVDGATGEPLESKWLKTEDRAKGQFAKWPSATVPEELRGKAFVDYAEEEKAALREQFKTMPMTAYAPSLTKLFAPK